MTTTSRHPLLLVRSVVICAALSAAPSASPQSIGVAPAEIRASVTGGEPVRFELSVANEGDTPVVMRTVVTDLWYDAGNEKVFGAPGSHPRSAADWIEFVPRDFTVPPRGTGTVNVVVTPPADVSGGHYAVVFVESRPLLAQAATAESRAVYTNMRLGVLVLLSASGTETYAVDVAEPRLTPPSATQDLTLEFELQNNSNTHIFPQVRLAILDDDRRLAARADGEAKRFLPGQRDLMALRWAGSLPAGRYTALLTLAYGSGQVYTHEIPFAVAGTTETPWPESRD